jgi:uncharacterized protein YuzE
VTTPSSTRMSLQVDAEAGAAYLRLSDNPVARTVEFSDDIYVDLNALDVVVGVELLDLGTAVPLDELERRFHVGSTALELLMNSISWGAPQSHVGTGTSMAHPVQFSSASTPRCPT